VRGHDAGRSGPRRWLAGALLTSLGLCGCADFWDSITSRDFEFRSLYTRPDPIRVLAESKDGDKRAAAFASLREPKRHGGSEQDQKFIVDLLTAAARNESQFYARLMAVEKLGEFKDPRAVPALVDAYYAASNFKAENATVLRCQALTGLGKVGDPAGAELLVRVLRQGPVEGPEEDRRRALDERIAAARALGHFPQYQATEALVGVLKTEKDVALRESAAESLQACTGKKLPADYQTWDDALHQPPGPGEGLAAGKPKGFFEVIQAAFTPRP
jgi:hypothetical protein